LIHDDLPAMDNDDLRRGRLSCHKQFSEWEAILAGDALQSLAFVFLSMSGSENLKEKLMILADRAGTGGMVSGQALDLYGERKAGANEKNKDFLFSIHRMKTAALLKCSLELGALCSQKDHNLYGAYGEKLGLLFQVSDDILDVSGTASDLGKTPGKDEASGKLTCISLFGLERTKQMAKELTEELEAISGSFPQSRYKEFFFKLPSYICNRNS